MGHVSEPRKTGAPRCVENIECQISPGCAGQWIGRIGWRKRLSAKIEKVFLQVLEIYLIFFHIEYSDQKLWTKFL